MKLLFVTQTIDRENDVLGFVHRWLEVLSGSFASIVAVGLGVGRHALPHTVRVVSLGKEQGGTTRQFMWRFLNIAWRERKNYDAVFVHMNEEYVLLAGLMWRLLGKKVFLWRNHPMGTWKTKIAVMFAHTVFCTSPHAFTAQFSKTKIMPAGIDTEMFATGDTKKRVPYSLVMLGRIAPIKGQKIVVDALLELSRKGHHVRSVFVGDALQCDEAYVSDVKISALTLGDMVEFLPAVPHHEAPRIFQTYEMFVNATPSGSLDKTILEAMASGCIPIVCNDYFRGVVDRECMFVSGDARSCAEAIGHVSGWSEEKRQTEAAKNRGFVIEHHSLTLLADKLRREIESSTLHQ